MAADAIISQHNGRDEAEVAAAYSTGVMMPMGFEFGWSRRLDVVSARDDEPEPKRFDLSGFIAEVNAIKRGIPALNEEGPQRLLRNQDDRLMVIERRTESGYRRIYMEKPLTD